MDKISLVQCLLCASMSFVKSIFKGISQVMLQENSLSGLLFLLGICLNDLRQGLVGFLSVIVATLFAKVLQPDARHMIKGLYGFNACLLGIGVMVFFELDQWMLLCLFSGILTSTLLTHLTLRFKFPAFTFPFVLSLWLILGIGPAIGLVPTHQALGEANQIEFWQALFTSFGQVFFQANLWTGVLFLLGLLVASWRVFLYTLLACVLCIGLAVVSNQSIAWINFGLLGFNSILAAIVFSNAKKEIIWAVLATVLAFLLSSLFVANNLIMLTAPFVFASWLCLLLKSVYKQLLRKA